MRAITVIINALRGLQSQSQEELDALLPSVLRPSGVGVQGRDVKRDLSPRPLPKWEGDQVYAIPG